MDYMSGDWGRGDINRWGPSAWATVYIWHDLGIIAEGHSMIVGGNEHSSNYKYFTGGGGLIYTSGYWGRFQPFVKGEVGYGSLTHPDNGTGHFHDTRTIYTVGGGVEYHTGKKWWTRVEYSYDFFPDFHSSITNTNSILNPRGFTFGETYRFGLAGARY
jgi:opacity protein-like surface antigen